MSGLMYQASFENVFVGGSFDNYFELTLGNAAIAIHFVKLSTDRADVTKFRINLATLGSTSTSGISLAEVPLQRRNTVAAQTAAEVNTNAGIPINFLYSAQWNTKTPFIYHPTPETRIILDSTSNNFVVAVVSGGNSNTSGVIIWEEF